jgi:hypothetical protein
MGDRAMPSFIRLPTMLSLLSCSMLLEAGADRDNPSLNAALLQEGIPLVKAHSADLNLRISSGAAFDSDIGRIFAYYAVGRESLHLPAQFYLFRHTNAGWLGGRFDWPKSNDHWQNGLESCGGGSLSASVSEHYVYVHGHVSPSAGCTMIFDHALRPITSLWNLQLLELKRGKLLLQKNWIHVSPERALKLSIFDLPTRRETAVFPIEQETPTRLRYRQQMGRMYRSCEAVPECFARLSKVMLNDEASSPSEDLLSMQYDAKLDALLLQIKVDDLVYREFFPTENWHTPHYWVLYKNLLGNREMRVFQAADFEQAFVARHIDSQQTKVNVSIPASTLKPTQAMLDWAWQR